MKTDWKLRFAPHLGFKSIAEPLFRESAASADPVDQIAYAAELGFAGVEDNYLPLRSVDEQERIGRALVKHGMEMGCCVMKTEPDPLYSWGHDSIPARDMLDRHLRRAIEACKRVGGRNIVICPKRDESIPRAFEFAGMLKNLRRILPMVERAGLTLCLEHAAPARAPGRLLRNLGDSYLLAHAADSDAVKIVFDVVHVQMMDGDIIANIDRSFDKIAVFQLGDVPGRCEPGSGEINYVAVLRHIRKRGFQGLLELEHLTELPGHAGEQFALERLRGINEKI